MPVATLGVRRLYDALGVNTSAIGEIHHQVTLLNGTNVSVYLGPKPPMGIASLENSQYGIPERDSTVFKVNSVYKAPAFLEVTIGISRELTPQQIELLQKKDPVTQSLLLEEANTQQKFAEPLLDVISGVLGLRIHRQLVLKQLVESCFVSGEFETVNSFIGSAVEMLESIGANTNTGPHLLRVLKGMTTTSEQSLMEGGAVLHWLLRAWREQDIISRFMFFFIPLEAILQSNAELAADSLADLEAIERIVTASSDHDKGALLEFIKRAKTKFSPSLNARFEDYARQAAIPGWELDVKAFKNFNRMRNLLLHAGNKDVRSHIYFEQNTRTLEDLVERYVSIALLGTPDVFQSKWRPHRSD
jgi:hypothetical protein